MMTTETDAMRQSLQRLATELVLERLSWEKAHGNMRSMIATLRGVIVTLKDGDPALEELSGLYAICGDHAKWMKRMEEAAARSLAALSVECVHVDLPRDATPPLH